MQTVTEFRWVRTNRHTADAWRKPGPWHLLHDRDLTWCGRRPGIYVSSQRRTTPATYPPAPPDTDCAPSPECRTALTADRPRAYRRR